jgi:hypothetical protein
MTTTLTTAEVRFLFDTPSAKLTAAQKSIQTLIYAADQGVVAKKIVWPENIRPNAVKKPVDRKAAAAKARETLRSNALAALMTMRAENAVADLDASNEGADASETTDA